MTRHGRRRTALDPVDHVHAVHDLAEYRIAPAVGSLVAMIEKAIVGDVDKELRSRRMRVRGAGHGDRAADVFQAVIGFVADRGAAALAAESGSETAALDHEIVDHPVKQGAVVEALFDIVLEVARRNGRLVEIEFDANGSEVGLQRYHGVVLAVVQAGWPL